MKEGKRKMKKTTIKFDWSEGYVKTRILSRSFETLQEAEKFAQGKDIMDIYISKGKYKVEWIKKSVID